MSGLYIKQVLPIGKIVIIVNCFLHFAEVGRVASYF